jgi:hypothetical protein
VEQTGGAGSVLRIMREWGYGSIANVASIAEK